MAVTKATLTEVDKGGVLEFHFNPKEISTKKASTWNRHTTKSAKSAAHPEFGGVQPQSLQMELFFDDWESGKPTLVDGIDKLMRWLRPDPDSFDKDKPQPLALRFAWGQQQFEGFLKSVSVKYTLFRSNGTPIRATAQIELEEVHNPPRRTNPTSGAIPGRRSHLVGAGDSLQSIAFREYDNPNLWRGLAAINGIDDPLRLRVGRRLLIPSADEAAAS